MVLLDLAGHVRVQPNVSCGGPSFSFFVLGLPHVTRTELRLALISYQDYHMLLLTPPQVLSVTLDRSLGFGADCAGTLTVRATGSSNRGFTPHNLAAMECGSQLNVSLPPTTALSYEFTSSTADADTAARPSPFFVLGSPDDTLIE